MYEGIQAQYRRRLQFCGTALFSGALLAGGCTDDGLGRQTKLRSAPPQALGATAQTTSSAGATVASGDSVAGPPATQATSLRQLTPELLEAFRLSGAIGDRAGREYDAALTALRTEIRHAQTLRTFYKQLPPAGYTARQQVVHMVGMIGNGADVPMLEGLAMSPLSPALSTTSSGPVDESTTLDQQVDLRSAAVVALSRISRRGESLAGTALTRLLRDGDKEMATLSAVELAASERLGVEERRVLAARGIRGSFAKMDFTQTFKVDPSDAAGNPFAKPAVIPPPSIDRTAE